MSARGRGRPPRVEGGTERRVVVRLSAEEIARLAALRERWALASDADAIREALRRADQGEG